MNIATFIETFIYIMLGVTALVAFTGIFVISFMYIRSAIFKNLEYKRYFSEPGATSGEEIFLIEELTNHTPFPMFGMDIESYVTSKIKLTGCESEDSVNQHFVSSFFVMPFTKVKRKHKAQCLKRGVYDLETAKVAYAGQDVYLDSRTRLYVYPKDLPYEIKSAVNKRLQYGVSSTLNVLEDVFEISGIKPYVSGVSANMINHKATARMGELMVNSHDHMMGRKVYIYINFHKDTKSHQTLERFEEMMELALSYASFISLDCAEAGFMYAVRANAKNKDGAHFLKSDLGTGSVYHMELQKELALLRYECDHSFYTMLEEDIEEGISGSYCIILTTYMDDAIAEKIEVLEKLGNVMDTVVLK